VVLQPFLKKTIMSKTERYIKLILTLLFWFFAIRQIVLYKDLLGTMFMFIIAISVGLAKKK